MTPRFRKLAEEFLERRAVAAELFMNTNDVELPAADAQGVDVTLAVARGEVAVER